MTSKSVPAVMGKTTFEKRLHIIAKINSGNKYVKTSGN